MTKSFLREHIKKIQPYQPIIPFEILSSQLGIPIEDLIKLDANENPYGMPPSARKRLENLQFGHIYPDPESRKLRQKLSEFLKIPFENILAGAGADELIDLIVRVTMDAGDKIINCPPTFGFYHSVAQINDLQIVTVRRNSDFSINLAGISRAASQGARLIFLANPNNPDGGILSQEELDRLLDLPILVIIDEAYVEFAPRGTSRIKEVLQRENLIVLRTFSKWGGLAGIRLGYGIFPYEISKAIMKIKQPYNVSVPASQAGLGAMEDLKLLNTRLECILSERTRLYAMLNELSWLQPYESHANFILSRVIGRNAEKLKKELANRGILIRYFKKPGLEDHVRFSIGKPQETDCLVKTLKEI